MCLNSKYIGFSVGLGRIRPLKSVFLCCGIVLKMAITLHSPIWLFIEETYNSVVYGIPRRWRCDILKCMSSSYPGRTAKLSTSRRRANVKVPIRKFSSDSWCYVAFKVCTSSGAETNGTVTEGRAVTQRIGPLSLVRYQQDYNSYKQ